MHSWPGHAVRIQLESKCENHMNPIVCAWCQNCIFIISHLFSCLPVMCKSELVWSLFFRWFADMFLQINWTTHGKYDLQCYLAMPVSWRSMTLTETIPPSGCHGQWNMMVKFSMNARNKQPWQFHKANYNRRPVLGCRHYLCGYVFARLQKHILKQDKWMLQMYIYIM